MMNDLDAKRDRALRSALEHRTELMAYARSLLGNYAAAEDAVQEAMLVVVKKFDQFREGTSMSAAAAGIIGGKLYLAGGFPNGATPQPGMWVRIAP